MVRKCLVCKTPQVKDSALSFHRFPKNEALQHEWLKACSLEGQKVADSAVICSKHFKVEDFDQTIWPTKRLLSSAVPFPSNIYKRKSTSAAIIQEMPTKQTLCTVSSHEKPATLLMDVQCVEVPSTSKISQIVETTILSNVRCVEGPSSSNISQLVETTVPRNVRYVGDLQTTDFATPRKAKRNLNFVKEVVNKQRKTVKTLRIQKHRLEVRINSFKDLLDHLREEKLLSEEAANTISDITPSTLTEIMNRQLLSKNRKYSPDLRAFALTLHFYSAKAYNYVRGKFNNLLPHPETIRLWYMVIDGEPGFTKEAFEALKAKTNGDTKVIVNLTLDEMSIREMIQWDGQKYHGYVDLGNGESGDGDLIPKARNALVFLVTAMNSSWKVPVAYFLIQSLNAHERANLLQTCLQLLHESGVECRSITFDGASVNISMARDLGANYIFFDGFKTWFPHINTKDNVYTIWDPCHMVKLIRNCIGDKKVLHSPEDKKIEWQFIRLLHELEKKEGLRAGTKLTARHINYYNEKMKVKLAVQTLSHSVSSALTFCKESNIPGFENCEATAEFCLIINNIFDILNARNLCAKSSFNRGLTCQNFVAQNEEIVKCINYLSNLKDENRNLIILTNRKVGFLGMIVSLKSYIGLYNDLVLTNYLRYILSFKLSQDHLETFFGAIRQKGGHNNNPSALQFKVAYKRLLVRHQVSASTSGNCTILDATTILHVGAGTKCRTRDEIIDETDIIISGEDHDYVMAMVNLSPFVEEVVNYICGFVVKRIIKHVTCSVCCELLYSQQSSSILIKAKKWGNLTLASKDVLKICTQLEKLLREYKQIIPHKKNIEEFLIGKLFLRDSYFDSSVMTDHILHQDLFDNHKIQLVKLIATTFLKVRLHHEGRLLSEESRSVSLRNKYTKLVLFRNE